MLFQIADLAPRDAYKLVASTIVPRPIALVTSQDENGLVNAAPFSFFNLMGSNPPIVAFNVGDRAPGEGKDTAQNIRRSREFVINLVDEELVTAMNICATNFPPDYSEIEAAQLELLDSCVIKTPRLGASPVNMECREHTTLYIGQNRIIIGEVVAIWIRDSLVNPQDFHVKTNDLHLIGRMGGGGGYVKTSDTFELARISFEEWKNGAR